MESLVVFICSAVVHSRSAAEAASSSDTITALMFCFLSFSQKSFYSFQNLLVPNNLMVAELAPFFFSVMLDRRDSPCVSCFLSAEDTATEPPLQNMRRKPNFVSFVLLTWEWECESSRFGECPCRTKAAPAPRSSALPRATWQDAETSQTKENTISLL